MKILAITDIHKDYDAAKVAYSIEAPDLVLDCGDHDQIINLFEQCPHFYIRGNHEPSTISYRKDNFPLPSYIPNGTIVEFSDGKDTITFSGIDGNYGSKTTAFQVNVHSLEYLREIKPRAVDILLLHESPLNVAKSSRAYPLAMQVMNKIERLQPRLVLSGHTNIISEYTSPKSKVLFLNLPDMHCGYGIITFKDNNLSYEIKKSNFGRK